MVLVRLLLLSDIHANYAALQAALNDAERRGFDQVVHLGDALGYGPQPHEVLSTLRDLGARCVRGNHEQLLLECASGARAGWGGVVTEALQWQLTRLSRQDLDWVASWPDGFDDPETGARYRHGTPASLDRYLGSVPAAREAFAAWEGTLAFVGHTHIPAVYATLNAPVGEWIKGQNLSEGGHYLVPPRARVILNPGSVGQPRDGDPAASYGLFDTARAAFEVVRVSYDVSRTQAAARRAGLPEALVTRLAAGR